MKEFDEDINYCTLIPSKIFGVDYNYGCYIHDEYYGYRVKYRPSRKECDLDLMDYIFECFKEKNKKVFGYIYSRMIYLFLRIFGSFFWYP